MQYRAAISSLFLIGCLSAAHAQNPTACAKWSKIELTLTGPNSQGQGEPNPFAIAVDVVFTGPNGRTYRVPGFYDGDGQRGPDGNVWKVRFSADSEGHWTWASESSCPMLNGHTGAFTVGPCPPDAQGFWRSGRLESVGKPDVPVRYLKFRDGPYWLKAGCDDPENFLGSYRNYDTLAKRKQAIDYLAQRGINSLYIMTHNVGGDDNDVWPWWGSTPDEARTSAAGNVRFDVAKLDQWRELFEYMQSQGVVPHIVLEDDSAWTGYDHQRYYREMIARFGYLPALLLNLGEEHNENYSLDQALDLVRQLSDLDPYDHPCGIHNVNQVQDSYVDSPYVHFTSIQTGSPDSRRGFADALRHNGMAIEWINRCKARGRRVLMVSFDEARPEENRRCWWSVYLAGGVWESHVRAPYDRPHAAWEPVWTELGGARRFLETLPFWQMEPRNDLVREGLAFCLAQPGQAYALYLPRGGAVTVDLAPNALYDVAWWHPANGVDGTLQDHRAVSGGRQQLVAPTASDWAVRIVPREP